LFSQKKIWIKEFHQFAKKRSKEKILFIYQNMQDLKIPFIFTNYFNLLWSAVYFLIIKMWLKLRKSFFKEFWIFSSHKKKKKKKKKKIYTVCIKKCISVDSLRKIKIIFFYNHFIIKWNSINFTHVNSCSF
jgi:hypothetical protein